MIFIKNFKNKFSYLNENNKNKYKSKYILNKYILFKW